jgi:hypothetical protein
MSDSTTELNLQLAVDGDDTADYLTLKLRQSLQSIDGLFNQAAGHTHSGPHQGGQIGAAAFTGPMDMATWFRSRSYGTSPPTGGVGLAWYWDPPNTRGVIEAYNHDSSSQQTLQLTASELDLTIGGGAKAFSFNGDRSFHFWNTDDSGGVHLRLKSGNGLEVLNAAQNAVTFSIDDSGNVTIPGTLTANGALSANSLNVNGASTHGGDIHLQSHSMDGITQLTFQSGANLHAAGDHVQATNHLDVSFDLAVGRNMSIAGNVTTQLNVQGSIDNSTNPSYDIRCGGTVNAGTRVAAQAGDLGANRGGGQGFVYLGSGSHYLGYNGGNYVFGGGGVSADWYSSNSGGRNGSYGLTIANVGGQTGRGIAQGWDTYSAARGKQDIKPIAEALAVITHPNVHGVTYQPLGGGENQVGFVAEDWHAVMPSVVSLDASGQPQAIDYGRIGAVTFQAVKELAAQVAALTDRITALEASRA